MSTIELLSPAKNLDFGRAAINSGADAIYMGAPRFGARAAASNSIADIEGMARYAHRFSAKLYVALNTLLLDSELDAALGIAQSVWNAGADALIIQDMGLLEMGLPPIPLIASTQTHNTTPDKVLFLERVGFQRVILARELSIDEITPIRACTTVELESFVHGSLCIGYSGQCYLGQALSGRSGNRGECPQPCRHTYHLVNQSGQRLITQKHLLSPKDLMMVNHLEALLQAGVTSFKIEGRLKDLTYVKNITALYRQWLDDIINRGPNSYTKPSSGRVTLSFVPDPQRSFNRGFTTHFAYGRQQGILSPNTPKSLGKQVGKVISVEANRIAVDASSPISNGDGLCFFGPQEQLHGFRVNRVEGEYIYPHEMPPVYVGSVLYRNHDQQFESMLERSGAERRIAVRMDFMDTPMGFALLVTDGDGNTATEELTVDKTLAVNPVSARATILNSLSKCGDTIFYADRIEIPTDFCCYVKPSVVNAMRRNALVKLDGIRIASYIRAEHPVVPNSYPYPVKELDYRANVLNRMARQFYARHGAQVIEAGIELNPNVRGKAVMTTRYCLKYEFGQCPKHYPHADAAWQQDLYLESGSIKLWLGFCCSSCCMEIIIGE